MEFEEQSDFIFSSEYKAIFEYATMYKLKETTVPKEIHI